MSVGRDPSRKDLGRDEIAPLVDALHDERPDVRVEVLDALLALPLRPDAWFEVGDYVRWALKRGGDAPERAEVASRAGRVPLLSVRTILGAIANTDDPATGAAARSLAFVGDEAALGPLLTELRTLGVDQTDAGRYLAMLDVSAAESQVDEACASAAPALSDGVMWLALALARAGRDAPLRSFIDALESGTATLPTLFWGDPEIARAELAPGPPFPPAVVTWLQHVRDDRSGDVETVAGVLLDANEPPVSSELVPDVDPGRVPGPEARKAAASTAASLLNFDRDGWDTMLARLPSSERVAVVSALVSALLERAADVFAGNHAVQVAHDHADDFVPDVPMLAGLAARGSPVTSQLAWAASRGGARLLVASLADGLAERRRRDETARFLARAARFLRFPGPLYLGGAQVAEPIPVRELIDDWAGAADVTAEEPGRIEEVDAALPSPPPTLPQEAVRRSRGSRRGPSGEGSTAPRAKTRRGRSRARMQRPRLTRPRPTAPERVLQAEVFDTSDAARAVRLSRGFRRGAWHRLVVAIAPEKTTALPGEGPSFDEVLGEQEHDLLLDFLFNANGAVPPDQALQLKDKVRLPVAGSAEVAFDFQLLATLDEVRIELEVRAGQRTIQPATLVGLAADDPATLPEGSTIRLLRGRPLANPSSAAARTPLDGIVSVSGDPASPVTTIGGAGRVSFIDTTGLRDATRSLELLLDSIITDDRTVPQSLTDDAVQQGLFKLALRGSQLYEAVGAQIVETLGKDASRIQLLLRNDSVVVPLELVYDLGAPARGAGLCPNWQPALSSGTCDRKFHPTADDGNAAVVCPSGFWAVSKMIERQVAPESLFSEAAASFDAAVQTELTSEDDSLPLLRGSVFAASDRVSRVDSKHLRETLASTVGRAESATSWRQWCRAVKRTRASLLVLLSHTVNDDTGRALQIGKGDNLYVAQVNKQYVSTTELPLIALLLGCETVENPEEFQSFVARFRSNGASLVIGTVCGVLGARAPRVATEILRQLAAAAGRSRPKTAGTVMQEVRRTLLAGGELTALALAAYGDVDWKITRA